jgi:thioredoxin 1
MRLARHFRQLLVAALLSTAIGLVPTPTAAMDQVPFDLDAVAAAQSNDRTIILGIWASWCGTCRAQLAVLEGLKDDPRFAEVTIFHIDYDRQKHIMRLLGASVRSQMIAFHGEVELGRLIGGADRGIFAGVGRRLVL